MGAVETDLYLTPDRPRGLVSCSVIFPDIENLLVCLRHSLILRDRRNLSWRRACPRSRLRWVALSLLPSSPSSSPAALHSSLRASASQSPATWEPRLPPCYFLGLARASSRDPQNDPNDLDRVGKNETATSIVFKVNTIAPKMATTKKTEARP